MAREEDESSTPTVAVADAEPAPSEALPHEGPIDLSTALDVAQVGLELMALVLAVPKGRAAAEAMARRLGAVIDALRPPFSMPGDAEAFLLRDAIESWLDAQYGPGLWVVDDFVVRRQVGLIVVAFEELRTGAGHILALSTANYRIVSVNNHVR